LLKIEQKYKVKGQDLRAAGYTIKDDSLQSDFWMLRDWDSENENWYTPFLVSDDKMEPVTPQIDSKRSVNHALGFVPWIWIKNLPGGNEIDGACTFFDAIDTSIEIDYLLSQGGRGLKYASDPTLLIKEPAMSNNGDIIKGAGNALVIGADGDARLLEINGTASEAMINYVKFLRELAIESIHGNRIAADKISAAQSGRALEIMNAALINLADKLRISYGEGALLSLLKMIVAASNKYPLKCDGEPVGKLNQKAKISLRWPQWYAPSAEDRMNTASALKTSVDAGIMSAETAVATTAADYDIEDVQAELGLIKSETAERIKNEQALNTPKKAA
ncbi:MAG: phage portal protein, partial [Pseudomonadota bacterium]|nr:phage portal protein [Pseudomonadota bacterium]